jgi:hypothetical protein
VKGRFSFSHQISVALLMNSLPLSLWNSKTGRGTVFLMSERERNVQEWALLKREYRQIQPEATSVAVRERMYWPEVVCPQW